MMPAAPHNSAAWLATFCATAVAAWLAVGLAAPAFAQESTPLDVSDDGKTITIPGEATPPPKDKLPRPTLHKVAADKPIAPASPKTPDAPPEIAVPMPPARAAIEFQIGGTWLPSGLIAALQTVTSPAQKRRDQHPSLQALTIDAGYRMALSSSAWVVFRGGLTLPDVPDQNWWSSTGTPRPLYTAISVVGIDLGADYLKKVDVTPWLAWTLRGGLGLAIVAGDVRQTETLPTCTAAQAATCPHWRTVGASNASLPPVLPMVRALTGLQFQVSRDLALTVEGGLRTAPYLGAGLNWSL